MTEEDLEEVITPEVMPSTQLATIIKETNLEPQLAKEFQINFEEHFRMANEWSKKAKKIIVTNETQKVLMEEARTARLFLRSKRLEIENFRKQKKEYYLRGGQAIDKVATFLKNMIEPIENHLDLQEHFIEYKKKAEDERLLAEARVKEDERLAQEARFASEEAARLHVEIERLRNEQEKIKKENAAKIAQEREEQQRQLEMVRKEQEEILRVEREKNAIVERELRDKKQAELKAEADRIRAEERDKSAGDVQKLINFRENLHSLISQFPDIKNTEFIRIAEDAKSYLWMAHSSLNQINEEEI